MADTKLSALSTNPTPLGSDLVYVVSSSTSYRETVTNLMASNIINVRITSTSTQTITAGAGYTTLVFPTDVQNTGSSAYHSLTSNNSRIKFPVACVATVTGAFNQTAAPDASSIIDIAIRLNGATYIGAQGITGKVDNCTLSLTRSFAANDYVELLAAVSGAINMDITASDEYSPIFTALIIPT